MGFRFTHDVVQNAPGLGFFPTTLNQDLYSAFLQDEITLRSDLSLIVGSKIEHNDYTGFQYEPNLRMAWSWLAEPGALGRHLARCPRPVAYRYGPEGTDATAGHPRRRRRLQVRGSDRL